MRAGNRRSTPSWLLPPPVRRFRGLLRELQGLTRETYQQVIDGRHQVVGALDALSARVDRLALPAERTGAARAVQAVVLAYHGVAEPTADPFELRVAPEQFEQHLEVLSRFGPILSVAELGQRLRNGPASDVAFAVTFDDGYADNLYNAKPILERHGVPATVFLPTGLLHGTSFWWDQLADLILDEASVGPVSIAVDGTKRRWNLDDGHRHGSFWELWELLRQLDHDRQREALDALCSQLGRSLPARDRALSEDEVPQLLEGGLIDIGAHTINHPLLTASSDEAARDEVAGSKRWLEILLERPVTAFAYPYGEYGAREVELVRQAGFEIAFSTAGAVVREGCDPLAVPRLLIGHWDAATLERRLAELLPAPSASTARPLDFGDLRRLTPVSEAWGFDRGGPVDRYYVERFLERRAGAIEGRVLEMAGEPLYARRLGGERVEQLELLDVRRAPDATYSCRLEDGAAIPSDSFDCVVCLQTLQYIYDFRSAVRTLHRIIKPGGILLLTVPGITPVHYGDEYGDAWHWSFTPPSAKRLCGEMFGEDVLELEVFGNILSATAFLYGLGESELTPDELDYVDPDYTVVVGVQAVKRPVPAATGQFSK